MTLRDGPASVEFDVAVSYVGEDLALVEAVVTELKRSGIRVFYDGDPAAGMWGHDLIEYLDRIYRLQVRYVIVFVSHRYKTKMRPRRGLARRLQEFEPKILPIRLDDTVLGGLGPTVGYLDARRMVPADIAAAVLVKLSATPAQRTTAPQTAPGKVDVRPNTSDHLNTFNSLISKWRVFQASRRLRRYIRRNNGYDLPEAIVDEIHDRISSANDKLRSSGRQRELLVLAEGFSQKLGQTLPIVPGWGGLHPPVDTQPLAISDFNRALGSICPLWPFC